MASPQLEDGFILLYRKVLQKGWLKKHKLWAFWCWSLLKASHQEHVQIVGLHEVTLLPGQFVFGRKKAAEELNMTEREVRTVLHFLLTSQNVTIKTTNKYSIVSIINWDAYQHPITTKRPSKRHINDQQVTTNNNGNNGNEKYIYAFDDFWKNYPARNGKVLGKPEAFKKYCTQKESDLPLINQAVTNYADSEDVKKGIGIRDPKRFLKDDYWRNWLESEQTQGNSEASYIDQVKERMGI